MRSARTSASSLKIEKNYLVIVNDTLQYRTNKLRTLLSIEMQKLNIEDVSVKIRGLVYILFSYFVSTR